ncbi:hypothetical protein [Pseudorhodoferax sp. Leaf267]|uniref:hypothetical protein n=1 Tax=Pseudorhodoferax sp. Leaf267 TaxID=1736316 RepID=UPI0006F7D82A|nr:hypothetical protein [Pseudorhodoferax sp. Leaf267]KQP18164.1 hypothetical protein ASF43_10015 [Pseudorhodoferax sp. Leaf267]
MPHHSLKLIVIAAALAAGSVAMAQDNTPPREQRMNEALQTYRDGTARNPQPGPAARAEESMKRGARHAGDSVRHGAHRTGEAVKHGAQRTGQAIKHGAQKAGDAVGTGMEKTGDAVRRGGEKLKDKSAG